MKRFIVITTLMIHTLLLAGCGVGLIYTHTVEPLNPNMHRTPIETTTGQGDVKQITIEGISVAWNDNALGDIARQNGITELYYADREVLSVVLGIWRQETIHLYGR